RDPGVAWARPAVHDTALHARQRRAVARCLPQGASASKADMTRTSWRLRHVSVASTQSLTDLGEWPLSRRCVEAPDTVIEPFAEQIMKRMDRRDDREQRLCKTVDI